MTSDSRRVLMGFVAAWFASVLVAFCVGGIIAFIAMAGHEFEFIKSIALGNKDALSAFFLPSIISAISAGIVAFFVILFIVWPLFIISRKYQFNSLRIYVLTGFFISLFVSMIFLIFQSVSKNFPGTGIGLEYIPILISGPVSALLLWWVVQKNNKQNIGHRE